ncbi:MAG: hypothetical protein OEV66_10100 [Spirochaetia bacterium]|nr:hypothetical protein [Spirochaetia bacterium]
MIFRFKQILLACAIYCAVFPVLSVENSNLEDSTTNGIEKIIEDLKTIWPDGKCAENISGDKRYILTSLACKADYSAQNRDAFLDYMVKMNWKIRKERYQIDKDNASYFYKFETRESKNIYVKLFFRDPRIIWPLHENKRPQISLVINNVASAGQLEIWEKIKLPWTVSLSLDSQDINGLSEKCRKSGFDTWIYLPDASSGDDSGNDNETAKKLLENLNRIAGSPEKNPEQIFHYSGLTVASSFTYLKKVDILRQIFASMRGAGLKMVMAPNSLEVADTAKIQEIKFIAAYYLGSMADQNNLVWHEAYENAKQTGHSVIILNAADEAARSFLLGKLQASMNYIEFTDVSHLWKKEKLNGQQ